MSDHCSPCPVMSGVKMVLSIGGQELSGQAFTMQPTANGYVGTYEDYTVRMELETDVSMLSFRAVLEHPSAVNCDWIRFDTDITNIVAETCLIPCAGKQLGDTAVYRPKLNETTPESSMYCGIFQAGRKPCVLFGTKLPQNNLHFYQATQIGSHTIRISAKTHFTTGQKTLTSAETETTMVYTGLRPLEAMEAYASHVPMLPAEKFADPLVGWSTWDYYASTITAEDLTENLNAIDADPELKAKMKCFMIDDGWEHCEGEWYANHRFPQGTAGIAKEIRDHGLIPGIWTNGCQSERRCYTGRRRPELFLWGTDGNCIMPGGMPLMDPTHPATEQFLFDTYRRLYNDGFRIFKIDFVLYLQQGDNFHDKACGPYEALRRLFAIIRRAVGDDSHIIGCSLPAECGAGLVDSSRISMDIHNWWAHLVKIIDFWQLRFWENGRLYRIDPDFLLVRGTDTAIKEDAVVKLAPNPPGMWSGGPAFDRYEAETWANIVTFAGGNVISSDRLTELNDVGMQLLKSHLTPGEETAVPLDLGERPVAALWYMRKTRKLLVLNLSDTDDVVRFTPSVYGLSEPCGCDKSCVFDGKTVEIALARHESAIVDFSCEKE